MIAQILEVVLVCSTSKNMSWFACLKELSTHTRRDEVWPQDMLERGMGMGRTVHSFAGLAFFHATYA